jgi:methyl-accepting chemotaxis protein
MNWFSNLKVKEKLYLLITIFTIAVIVVGVLGYVRTWTAFIKLM